MKKKKSQDDNLKGTFVSATRNTATHIFDLLYAASRISQTDPGYLGFRGFKKSVEKMDTAK